MTSSSSIDAVRFGGKQKRQGRTCASKHHTSRDPAQRKLHSDGEAMNIASHQIGNPRMAEAHDIFPPGRGKFLRQPQPQGAGEFQSADRATAMSRADKATVRRIMNSPNSTMTSDNCANGVAAPTTPKRVAAALPIRPVAASAPNRMPSSGTRSEKLNPFQHGAGQDIGDRGKATPASDRSKIPHHVARACQQDRQLSRPQGARACAPWPAENAASGAISNCDDIAMP